MDAPSLVQVDPLDLEGKFNEEWIQMAISVMKWNGFKANGNPSYSFHEAAQMFHVSKTTLTACFNGQKTCKEGHKHKQSLNDAAEAALVEWIQECGHQNIPLHPSAMAAYAKAISGVEIGECWVQCFQKRHPELQAVRATLRSSTALRFLQGGSKV